MSCRRCGGSLVIEPIGDMSTLVCRVDIDRAPMLQLLQQSKGLCEQICCERLWRRLLGRGVKPVYRNGGCND